MITAALSHTAVITTALSHTAMITAALSHTAMVIAALSHTAVITAALSHTAVITAAPCHTAVLAVSAARGTECHQLHSARHFPLASRQQAYAATAGSVSPTDGPTCGPH